MEKSKLNLIAHRMNIGNPENEEHNQVDNSLEALESVLTAMDTDSDSYLSLLKGFECDVRRTKKNELVVVHDASLRDMTSEKIKTEISDMTYDELKEHTLLNAQFYYKGLKKRALLLPDAKRIRRIISQRLGKTTVAPLASDVFDFLSQRGFEGEIVMELKGLDDQTVDAAIKLINSYKSKLNIAVKNFCASKMKPIGDKTGVRIGLLDGPWFINKRQAIDCRFVENFKFDFYSLLWTKVNKELLESLALNGKDLYLWTVDSATHLSGAFKRLIKIKESIGVLPANINLVTNVPILLEEYIFGENEIALSRQIPEMYDELFV